MSRTGDLINHHKAQFPEHQYYSDLLLDAEDKIDEFPDITIEACSSVLTGISKTILDKAGVVYKEKGRDADTPSQLFRRAAAELAKLSEIDEAFLQNSAGIILRLSELRNERGDISHGKAVPKKIKSDTELARFVFEISDSLCVYLLGKYFSVDWSVLEEVKYEDNLEFNDSLDEGYDLPGILYSKALYEQDPVSYKQQLENYLAEQDEENI